MKPELALPEARLTFSPPLPVIRSTAVIPSRHLGRWIEPWYVAYAILGALASGSAVILIPLAVMSRGGSATQIGAAIAAQNVGALFAPFWGWASDRFKDYRPIFFGGFLLIGAGFLSFALLKDAKILLVGAFLIGLGTGAANTVACLFVVEFTPAKEWGQRISWLQTFNAIGSVLGLAEPACSERRGECYCQPSLWFLPYWSADGDCLFQGGSSMSLTSRPRVLC